MKFSWKRWEPGVEGAGRWGTGGGGRGWHRDKQWYFSWFSRFLKRSTATSASADILKVKILKKKNSLSLKPLNCLYCHSTVLLALKNSRSLARFGTSPSPGSQMEPTIYQHTFSTCTSGSTRSCLPLAPKASCHLPALATVHTPNCRNSGTALAH